MSQIHTAITGYTNVYENIMIQSNNYSKSIPRNHYCIDRSVKYKSTHITSLRATEIFWRIIQPHFVQCTG